MIWSMNASPKKKLKAVDGLKAALMIDSNHAFEARRSTPTFESVHKVWSLFYISTWHDENTCENFSVKYPPMLVFTTPPGLFLIVL